MKEMQTSIEKASLVAIKGTSGSVGEDPEYNTGNILDGGDLIDDMPLFRVKIESLTITAVEPLFTVFDSEIRKKLAELSNVDNTADANKTVNIAKKLSNEKAIEVTKDRYISMKMVFRWRELIHWGMLVRSHWEKLILEILVW